MTPSSLIDCLDGCLDGCLGDCLGGLGAHREWMGRSERTAALRGGLLILSAGAATGCVPRFPGNARDVVIVSTQPPEPRISHTSHRAFLPQPAMPSYWIQPQLGHGSLPRPFSVQARRHHGGAWTPTQPTPAHATHAQPKPRGRQGSRACTAQPARRVPWTFRVGRRSTHGAWETGATASP